MKKILCLLLLIPTFVWGQTKNPQDTEVWEPEPRMVTPGETPSQAPSDAIILFDGTSLEQWQAVKGGEALWFIENGALTVKRGTGAIKTKQTFGDCQLHIEWRTPDEISGEGQGRGNSGVFLQERYEVQVLDSYENRTYSNGQAGSIYKQFMPLVNASKPPGTWQTYDIIFKAPQFNQDGIVVAPAYVTALHNGVLVQNHVQLQGPTEYIGLPQYEAHGKASIMLQDHGNPVSFRNIWIRPLD